MDGVLVVDKPQGMTSHDVVALARRALGERRIGHTGTLDPLATGVLPLACGRATRLVRFLTASDKTYEATIRFGVATDSYDIMGTETHRTGRHPEPAAVEGALATLRGSYEQLPPPFSAKKVGGQRAYTLARRQEPVTLSPVPVHVSQAELVSCRGGAAIVRITCSAGFYVRSLAHALGELTGTGACLEALRRTRSGEFRLDQAVTVMDLHAVRDAGGVTDAPSRLVAARMIGLDRLLPGLPGAVVSEEGRRHVAHGRAIGPPQVTRRIHAPGEAAATWIRLMDPAGHLIALGTEAHGALHPSVVLI